MLEISRSSPDSPRAVLHHGADDVSPPGSDDAIRALKASESVTAAFHGEGLPPPNGALAALLAEHVRSATKGIPIQQLRHMAPGTGMLGTSAAEGVNLYLSSLTPQQREVAKNGGNPLDPAAMLALAGTLNPANGGKLAAMATSDRGPGDAGGAKGGPGTSSTAYGAMANIADPGFAKSLGVAPGTVTELARLGLPASAPGL